ncbi:MAG: hypothetical protein U0V72_06215 [Cytophagales bacterium]
MWIFKSYFHIILVFFLFFNFSCQKQKTLFETIKYEVSIKDEDHNCYLLLRINNIFKEPIEVTIDKKSKNLLPSILIDKCNSLVILDQFSGTVSDTIHVGSSKEYEINFKIDRIKTVCLDSLKIGLSTNKGTLYVITPAVHLVSRESSINKINY